MGWRPGSGATFPVGTTTETYTVTDASGGMASCSFTITVVDNEVPVLVGCLGNMSLNNDPGLCGAVVAFSSPTATDNCGAASVSQTAGPASGSLFPVGTSTVTFTATDGTNMASCSFDVTVIDAESPVITCPTNIAVSNDTGVCGATVNFADATATDNCTATVSQTAGLASGSVFPVGTSMVTFSATDGVNAPVTCTFSVTVTDDEAPVITCPLDITVSNDTGVCGATVKDRKSVV